MAIKWFKLYLAFIFILMISILIGMRVLGEDSDFHAYSAFYESITHNFTFFDTRFEWGFVALSYFFKQILEVDIFFMLISLAFVSLLIKAFIFDKIPNPILITVLYLTSFGLLHEMTQIRVALAVSFVLLSLYYRSKNSMILSLLLFLVAISLHYSMMFFLIAYLVPDTYIRNNKLKLPYLFFYGLVSALLLYFLLDIFISRIPMLQVYAARADSETFNFLSIRVIGLIVPLILGLTSFKDFTVFNKRCFIISISAFIISIPASIIPTLASRLFELGWVCFYFWVSAITSPNKKFISLFLLSLVSIYFFIRNVYLEPIFGF